MIQARFPIWRTNPANASDSAFLPFLTGTLSVLLVPPLLGLFARMVSAFIGEPAKTSLAELSIILIASPIISWAALLVAVPVSLFAARAGVAGWAVALLAGGVVGMLTILILEGEGVPAFGLLGFAAIGAAFAGLYWLSIRMIHPSAIGVPFLPEQP